MVDENKITIMFVPGDTGRTAKYTVRKSWLIGGLVAGLTVLVVSVLFAITVTVLYTRGSLQSRKATREDAKAAERYKAESEANKRDKEEIARIHNAYVAETKARVSRLEDFLGRMETFTGIQFLKASPADTAEVVTTKSAKLDGRGGEAHFLLGRIDPSTVLSYSRDRLESMDRQVQMLDVYYQNAVRAQASLEKQTLAFAHTPLIVPVDGRFEYTDGFGMRIHPIFKRKDFHEGLDMAAPVGTRIIATADGVVLETGSDSTKGRFVQIDHGLGASFDDKGNARATRYKTAYYHCQKVLVKKGQKVKRGDLIAEVGSTGLSTGPHLHYEVYVNGKKINPASFILDRPRRS